MSRTPTPTGEHAPQNAMRDPDEIARFYDFCSDLMRELLDTLRLSPDTPRPFGVIEDQLGWPRRRIASMLGGVARLRIGAFNRERPYHLADESQTVSGRWEIWVDGAQSDAIAAAQDGWTHSMRRRGRALPPSG